MRPAIQAVRDTGTALAEVALCYTGDLSDPAEQLYTLDYSLRLAEKIVEEDLSVRAAEAAATAVPKLVKAKPLPGRRQGHLDEIAEHLGDRLDTRVKINLGARKGQITVDFATIGDLNRILTVLGEPGFSAS